VAAVGSGCAAQAALRRVGAIRMGDELVAFAIAVAARLSMALTSGGLHGNYGYDASVYYAAADALVHGRLPYRDFTLLHPPGIMLALAPFACLGRLTTDETGFILANLAFTTLGALNAVLVVRIAKHVGLGRRAALIGGCFYAVWFGAVQAEYLARLEPLGNFLLLCGVLAYFAALRSGRPIAYFACGAALGAAASVKIWWSVPLLVILGGLAMPRRLAPTPAVHLSGLRTALSGGPQRCKAARQGAPTKQSRSVLLAVAGAIGALVLVNVVFFVAAPGPMFHMVITEQLGRPQDANTTVTRLASMTGLDRLLPHLDRPALLAVLGAVVAGVACIYALAATAPKARLVVALVVTQFAVLLAAPSWFGFYADFAAPALALGIATVAGAPAVRQTLFAHRPVARRASRLAWVPLAAVASVTVLIFGLNRNHAVQPFPGTLLARDVSRVRCVQSDSPMALIELNALSRDLRHSCPLWVDVTGRTYAPGLSEYYADGAPVPRRANARWQRDLRAYLMSGNAVVIIRARGTGLSPSTTAAIERGGVLGSARGVVVYRTERPATSTRTSAHVRVRRHDDGDDRRSRPDRD
jgi:alpha-1,2-mannosyltransferase